MQALRTLSVRNVEDRLLREARAVAAREGKTLGALVIEAIADRITRGPTVNPLADDLAWYEAGRAAIAAEHAGEYVAIEGRRIVDHDVDFDRLATRIFEAGVRPVLMPFVTPGERVVSLRGPRRA